MQFLSLMRKIYTFPFIPNICYSVGYESIDELNILFPCA
jgi:hypothetical protein